FDSGLALVKPAMELTGPVMRLGSATRLAVGDEVTVVGSGGEEPALSAYVVAKQEFAGRWEYVLDEAIFTAPPHESWSGAALLDGAGALCGLGSLVMQGFEVHGTLATVNMFVPMDLLVPIMYEVVEHGRKLAGPLHWLALLL